MLLFSVSCCGTFETSSLLYAVDEKRRTHLPAGTRSGQFEKHEQELRAGGRLCVTVCNPFSHFCFSYLYFHEKLTQVLERDGQNMPAQQWRKYFNVFLQCYASYCQVSRFQRDLFIKGASSLCLSSKETLVYKLCEIWMMLILWK